MFISIITNDLSKSISFIKLFVRVMFSMQNYILFSNYQKKSKKILMIILKNVILHIKNYLYYMETTENKTHSHSHRHHHKHHRSENVYVYQVETNVSKNVLNLAFTAAVLGQLLFFLSNFSISAVLGSDGTAFVILAHVLRTVGEGFLLYCLMKGMSSLLYPLKPYFIAAIFFFILFHIVTSICMLFNITAILEDIGIFFYMANTITYFVLGFKLKQRYRDSMGKLGVLMMTYIILSMALSLVGLNGVNIYADLVCIAVGVYYIVTLRDRFDVNDYDF